MQTTPARGCSQDPSRSHETLADDPLHNEKPWPPIRPVTGLVEAPPLRPDGTLLRGEP
jgi:hypothetical protein